MLDKENKQKIDDLRQILVGKVTDPRSQVEQITNALLYKFMNDMDEESVSLGGVPSYFVNEYKKYSWKILLDKKTSGEERVRIYAEALEKMYFNENLPQTFREIFKNSTLPFKEAKVFNKFITRVNDFEYSNSESLGNAFEYLLSFMGKQGDAGQFRTPRHIIDFLVELINPEKKDKILDPASGTAGFLISAYKYILNQNKKIVPGDLLNADDRKNINSNLNGYDISPEFLKVSLMNMFLHKFNNPNIFEYDTLSDDNRWNEYFDVILANPPFFSPKGGITPHNRFSIKSNRAEVLFTDYIDEHLKPNGRAGIIVPEGVIFRNDAGYKSLRIKLIKNSLIGVVSLPAGVFQPYSGVKTSILILDKKLRKERDYIFYAKINNDGFTLTTNRKPIDDNDIPDIKSKIKNLDFSNKTKLKKIEIKDILKGNILEISKENIEINKDIKFRKLHEVASVAAGSPTPENKDYFKNGNNLFIKTYDVGQIKFGTINNSREYLNSDGIKKLKLFKKGTILFPKSGASTLLNHRVMLGKNAYVSSTLATIKANESEVLDEFLLYVLKKIDTKELVKNTFYPGLNLSDIKNIEIPLPSIDEQKKIVQDFKVYQKIIDGCNQVIENYEPLIDIEHDWKIVELGSICNLIGGGTPSKNQNDYWSNGTIKWLSCKHLDENGSINGHELISEKGLKSSSSNVVNSGSVILASRVSLGKVVYTHDEYAINQDLTGICTLDSNKIENFFIYLFLRKIKKRFLEDGRGLGVKGITRDYIKKIKIPIPPIAVQKQIIKDAKQDLKFIDENKEMAIKLEKRISNKLNSIWSN